jgi:hypothetical protein
VLEEDDATNRLLDSLACLTDVSKNPSLSSIPFLIFLNKHDLFIQKISEVPLTHCFPDFTGTCLVRFAYLLLGESHDHDAAVEFIKEKVHGAFKGNHMYPPQVTCAIDTSDILKVWEACEVSISSEIVLIFLGNFTQLRRGVLQSYHIAKRCSIQ